MNEKVLNELIKNKKKLNRKIIFYIDKKILIKQKLDINEIKGHLEKARHNLYFVVDTSKEKYSDWIVAGCYYAVYHSVLALILNKGYTSKNHDASLCVLIKKYYGNEISKKEIELVNNLFINYNDLVFYVYAKNKREEATYSTKYSFDNGTIDNLILKSRDFINKIEGILKENI